VDRACLVPAQLAVQQGAGPWIYGLLPEFRPRVVVSFWRIDRAQRISGAGISCRSWTHLLFLWQLQFYIGRSDDVPADHVRGADRGGNYVCRTPFVRHAYCLCGRSVLGGVAAATLAACCALGNQFIRLAFNRHDRHGTQPGKSWLVGHDGGLLRPGDVGEPVTHVGTVCHPGLGCLSKPQRMHDWILDVCLGHARCLRGVALAECAGSARIYSSAQQSWIRVMAGEPRRGQRAFRSNPRTAAKQAGILRLRAGRRGGVHAEQISAGQELYPRPLGRVPQAQRDAGDSLLDGRWVCSEFRRGRITCDHHFAAGAIGPRCFVGTTQGGGHALSAADTCLPAALLHYPSRLPLQAFAGSAAYHSQRLRSHSTELLLERGP
jgi:hypothetical protein